MWKRSKKAERLPWYRSRNYKGDLTESVKRELDTFRSQEKHPAVRYKDLPEEAQHYISRLELEVYDDKQQRLAGSCLLVSAIGLGSIILMYLGYHEATAWKYLGGLILLILPWPIYVREWRKNAENFLPRDAPNLPTDEALRVEWEIEYLARRRGL